MKPRLSRYEVARIVGMRALQLSDGAFPLVVVGDEALRCDPCYVAALELHSKVLDMRVRRVNGEVVDVRAAHLPLDLSTMLDSRDGGTRAQFSPSVRSEHASISPPELELRNVSASTWS